MPFGQLILGPPGSGKSTYCAGLQQYYEATNRKAIIVNLDPANDLLPYNAAIDINHLITLDDVQNTYKLGPNGGLIYCLEFLAKNREWLRDELAKFPDSYVLFDFPGQVELYTIHDSTRELIGYIHHDLQFQLCNVHLIDSSNCTDASKYISTVLLSLNLMCSIELPTVNILSKVDLLKSYGKLDFNLDYYTEVQDLNYLLDCLNSENNEKYAKLNKLIIECIENYSLVSFITLNINDKYSIHKAVQLIDKSNGFLYTTGEKDINSLNFNKENVNLTKELTHHFDYDTNQETHADLDDEGEEDELDLAEYQELYEQQLREGKIDPALHEVYNQFKAKPTKAANNNNSSNSTNQSPAQQASEKQFRTAAASNNMALLKKLLAEGVNINAAGPDTNKTALHWAVEKGHINVIEYLLSNGADYNAQNNQELSSLLLAQSSSNTTLLQCFLPYLKANKKESLIVQQQ
jgi:GTPase SAR1 family protein